DHELDLDGAVAEFFFGVNVGARHAVDHLRAAFSDLGVHYELARVLRVDCGRAHYPLVGLVGMFELPAVEVLAVEWLDDVVVLVVGAGRKTHDEQATNGPDGESAPKHGSPFC